MNVRMRCLVLFGTLLLAGCVTAPQTPVTMNQAVLTAKSGKIGVGSTALPKIDVQVPGASCLLCLLAANAANSSLSSHASTLPYEDISKLKEMIAERLKNKGLDAFVIPDDINVDALDDLKSDTPNSARKNFAPLQKKYNIDRLVVINVKALGFIRTYSAYFPTSEPKSMIDAAGYLVNLSNNQYEWYQPINILRSTDKAWDEPPKFPGLSNAYFQVIETAKDRFLEPFNQ